MNTRWRWKWRDRLHRYNDRIWLVVECGATRSIHRHTDEAAQQDIASKARGAGPGNFFGEGDNLGLETIFFESDSEIVVSIDLHRAGRRAGHRSRWLFR
jgi:hypothetical protein